MIHVHFTHCIFVQMFMIHMIFSSCPPYLSATNYKSSTTTTDVHSPNSSAMISTALPAVAGVTNVSFDQEPFQNSSNLATSGFVKMPIPEHNPDPGCRVHFPPIQSHGNSAAHMPHDAAVYLIPAPGGKSAHINQLLVRSKEDLPHDLSSHPHGTVIYSTKRTDNMQVGRLSGQYAGRKA